MEELKGRITEEIQYLFEQLGYEVSSLDAPLIQEDVEPIDQVFVKRVLEEKFGLAEDALIKGDAQEEKETVSTIAHSIMEDLSKKREV